MKQHSSGIVLNSQDLAVVVPTLMLPCPLYVCHCRKGTTFGGITGLSLEDKILLSRLLGNVSGEHMRGSRLLAGADGGVGCPRYWGQCTSDHEVPNTVASG
jgi:hypothetical protein